MCKPRAKFAAPELSLPDLAEQRQMQASRAAAPVLRETSEASAAQDRDCEFIAADEVIHWSMRRLVLAALLLGSCSLRPDPAPPVVRSKVTPPPIATVAPSASDPLEPPPEPGARPELLTLGRAVERVRLERDVRSLARARTPGSAGWKQVQRLLAQRLTSLGFEVELQSYATGVNVIGTLKGEHGDPVLVSAHYDHIARCPGADDNASGLAAALEVGRLLAPHPHLNTLVIAFWDEEERGLLGSRAYAARAQARGQRISVALSFDAIGAASDRERSQRTPEGFASLLPEQAALLTARGSRADFVAVVANPRASVLARRLLTYAAPLGLQTMYLEVPLLQAALMPDLFRSDHASFWLAGYGALLLTDTAELRNPRYHCQRGSDSPDTLDYAFLSRVTGAALAATAALLDER